jgi:hypothetical protein
MTLILTDTDYNDWRWGGAGINPPGGTAAATLTQIGTTGCYAFGFSNNTSMVFHDLQLPHDYAEGTDLIPHIHWFPSTTATYAGTWTLTYVNWLSIATGAAIQAAASVTVAFNSAMTANEMQTADFSANITGTNRKISSVLTATLSLSLTSGTLCFLGGIDAHYQVNSLGSRTVSAK